MRQRHIKDINHRLFIEQIRLETICRLKRCKVNLVGRISPINIQITEEMLSDKASVEKIIINKRMSIQFQLSNESN